MLPCLFYYPTPLHSRYPLYTSTITPHPYPCHTDIFSSMGPLDTPTSITHLSLTFPTTFLAFKSSQTVEVHLCTAPPMYIPSSYATYNTSHLTACLCPSFLSILIYHVSGHRVPLSITDRPSG